ncbi:alpha-ribazole phosphatase [Methylophilaceae bacterium]|nr:alpha-ribazole phosphatase [Methylophilaceae bacterium]
MKLYLVRHTRLSIESGICYGQADVDVAPGFHDEVAAIRTKLSGIKPVNRAFDGFYTSPLQRCHKLADALGYGEAVADERLKELNFGDWELQQWDAIPRPVFDRWASDYAHSSPPNGETFADLHQRARNFVEELRQRHAGQDVLVVTHGGLIRALLADVLNMPLKGLFRFEVDYGSVTQLSLEGEIPRIGFVNR